MNFNIFFILLIALLVFVFFLPRAMDSRYSVNLDFKLLMCALHLGIQPNDAPKNELDKSSAPNPDKTNKK